MSNRVPIYIPVMWWIGGEFATVSRNPMSPCVQFVINASVRRSHVVPSNFRAEVWTCHRINQLCMTHVTFCSLSRFASAPFSRWGSVASRCGMDMVSVLGDDLSSPLSTRRLQFQWRPRRGSSGLDYSLPLDYQQALLQFCQKLQNFTSFQPFQVVNSPFEVSPPPFDCWW